MIEGQITSFLNPRVILWAQKENYDLKFIEMELGQTVTNGNISKVVKGEKETGEM